MTVDLDGRRISSLDDGWATPFSNPATQKDLTLYNGNSPARALPSNGVIERIEIDT